MSSRAVTYHRVSTRDQRPDLVREELRQAAQARGLDLVDEIEEVGSGARSDRPGLQRVLDLARRGEVGVVLVWKLDRLGRSVLDLLANVEVVNDAGVTLVATSQGLELKSGGDALSRLQLSILGAVAEFERELIRERTTTGLEKAKARGVRLGRPPALDRTRIAQARLDRADGRPWSEVARRAGASISTVKRALRAAGQKGGRA